MPPKSAPSTPTKASRAKAAAPKPTARGPTGLTKAYLVAYNALSGLAWAYCLLRLGLHMRGVSDVGQAVKRAGSAYADFGHVVQAVQTAALLEVGHAAVGIVRSGLGTTIAQVSSRILMVWYICQFYPSVAMSPFYASMVFAWSFTEVVRYSHYTTGLLGIKVDLLEYLRYSTFYVLYPLGAGSEAALVYLSAAKAQSVFGIVGYWGTLALVTIWPPALMFMMMHMHAQRRKHVSGHSAANLVVAAKSIKSKVIDESVALTTANDTPARSTRSKKVL